MIVGAPRKSSFGVTDRIKTSQRSLLRLTDVENRRASKEFGIVRGVTISLVGDGDGYDETASGAAGFR